LTWFRGLQSSSGPPTTVTGGTFIPLLSLGIPGDPATAVILSGLLIHGMLPGPMLFVAHPEICGVYLAIILAHVFILVIQLFGIRFSSRS
jgi:putative tricarboxylic transport membrane protein